MDAFHFILMSILKENLCQAENDICITLNGVVKQCKPAALDLWDLWW